LSEVLPDVFAKTYQRKVWELGNARPHLFVRGAHLFQDTIKGAYLAIFMSVAFYMIAFEQRVALYHFGEYASDRPHVDWCGILFLSEKELWGPVPDGHHPLCPWLSWQVKDTCESEIYDL